MNAGAISRVFTQPLQLVENKTKEPNTGGFDPNSLLKVVAIQGGQLSLFFLTSLLTCHELWLMKPGPPGLVGHYARHP